MASYIEINQSGEIKGKIQGFSGKDDDFRSWRTATKQVNQFQMSKPWLTDGPVQYTPAHETLKGVSHETWETYQNVVYSQTLQILPSDFPKVAIAKTLAVQGNFTSLWNQLTNAYEGMGDRLTDYQVQALEVVKREGKHNLGPFLKRFLEITDHLHELDSGTYTRRLAYAKLKRKIPSSVTHSDVLETSSDLKDYNGLLRYLQDVLNKYSLEQRRISAPPAAIGLAAQTDLQQAQIRQQQQALQMMQALSLQADFITCPLCGNRHRKEDPYPNRQLGAYIPMPRGPRPRSQLICYYCQRPGHTKATCYENPISSFYRGGGRFGAFDRGGFPRGVPPCERFPRGAPRSRMLYKTPCPHCGLKNHTAAEYWRNPQNQQAQANMITQQQQQTPINQTQQHLDQTQQHFDAQQQQVQAQQPQSQQPQQNPQNFLGFIPVVASI